MAGIFTSSRVYTHRSSYRAIINKTTIDVSVLVPSSEICSELMFYRFTGTIIPDFLPALKQFQDQLSIHNAIFMRISSGVNLKISAIIENTFRGKNTSNEL